MEMAPWGRNTLERELREVGLVGAPVAFEVLGRDTREYWANTRAVPYRWICCLELGVKNPDYGPNKPRFLSQPARATGLLIGPRWVLTAAHVLWLKEPRRPVDHILVMPGRNERAKPFGAIEADRWQAARGWDPKRGPRPSDFAVVRLKEAVGTRTFPNIKELGGQPLGWWGSNQHGGDTRLKMVDPIWLKGKTLTSAGYPGDTCGTRQLNNDEEIRRCATDEPEIWASTQWRAAGKAREVDCMTGILSHTIDTFGGQSGAPVWYAWRDRKAGKNKRWLVGVHVAPGFTFRGQTRLDNAAVWIRQHVIVEIRRLQNELSAQK